MGFKIVEFTLGAAVADDGTVTGIAYPAGTNQAFFTGGNANGNGVVFVDHNDEFTEIADEVDITYGGSTITLTNKTGQTWAAGTAITLQLGYATPDGATVVAQPALADPAELTDSPATADALRDDIVAKLVPAITGILSRLRAAGVIDT